MKTLQQYFLEGLTFDEYNLNNENFIQTETNHEKHEFYQLNAARTNRLNKKWQLSDEQKKELDALSNKIELLVITEGWCGDASQILPIIQKMVEYSSNVNARIVYRDQNHDLINQYLTNGTQSIPIVVGIDVSTGKEKFHWGPRPQFGMQLLSDMKNGTISKEQFYIDLQKAYNKDKGASIFNELLKLITK